MAAITDSEWRVLSVLWDCDGAALGGVTEALKDSTGWSRNTVLTYLTRMEAKGLVVIDKRPYPHLYRAAVSREECQAAERKGFLERVYRGSAGDLVAAFLKEQALTPQERADLKRLLDDMEV